MISVVIPVYNTPKDKLLRAKASLDRQTEKDFEMIWVDDGSQKDTADFLDGLVGEKSRVIHKENQGIFAARASGFSEARGDYLFFLDSDDYLDDDALSCLLQEAKRTKADMVIASFYTETEGQGKKGKPWFLRGKSEELSQSRYVSLLLSDGKIRGFVWGRLYSASLLHKVLPFSYPNRIFEDVPLGLLCGLNAGKISYLSLPLYHYMVGDKRSLTNRPNPRRAEDHLYAFFYLHDCLLDRGDPELWRIFQRHLPRMILSLDYDLRVSRQGGLAKEEAKKIRKQASLLHQKTTLLK